MKQSTVSYYSRNMKFYLIIIVMVTVTSAFKADNRVFEKGEPAPSFEAELFETGEIITNNSLEGRYVLIDIWSTSCGICVRKRPELEEARNQFESEEFVILSIAMNDTPERLEKFREERSPMPWLHVAVPNPRKSIFWEILPYHGLPQSFLLSPDGTVIAVTGDFADKTIGDTIADFLSGERS
ncbi:MAG: TlpA family protein disulfide reductase [Balneolaceae bacterium]